MTALSDPPPAHVRILAAGDLVTPDGRATAALADQWKLAGAVPNLYAGTVIADGSGRPTATMVRAWRSAWGGANELDPAEPLFTSGAFTASGLRRWAASAKQ